MDELLKLDIKNVDVQLKDSELESGVSARQALKDVRNSGRQGQCYLGFRFFSCRPLLTCRNHWN